MIQRQGKKKKKALIIIFSSGSLPETADWLVKSNVEAGEGFADIIVETDDPDAGIVAELKYTKNFDDMKMTCQKAIAQIRDRRYQEYLLNDDRKDIRLYGITFCKKRCCAISEKL
ncbi:MAG: PD-(D/E)XK nuclease domain-containing protein [Clostridium fessum]